MPNKPPWWCFHGEEFQYVTVTVAEVWRPWGVGELHLEYRSQTTAINQAAISQEWLSNNNRETAVCCTFTVLHSHHDDGTEEVTCSIIIQTWSNTHWTVIYTCTKIECVSARAGQSEFKQRLTQIQGWATGDAQGCTHRHNLYKWLFVHSSTNTKKIR